MPTTNTDSSAFRPSRTLNGALSTQPSAPRKCPTDAGYFSSWVLRGQLLLKPVLMVVLAIITLQLGWQIILFTISLYPFILTYAPAHLGSMLSRTVRGGPMHPSWVLALNMMRQSNQRYVVVHVKNGLGNRLRALASAMAVAAKLNRPVLLIWVPDLHCNCSFLQMFDQPLHFALLEEEMPRQVDTCMCMHKLRTLSLMRSAGMGSGVEVVVDA